MKIFLDDMREVNHAAFQGMGTPSEDNIYFQDDWVIVRSVNAFKALLEELDEHVLEANHIECVSFDHDLGTKETGYDAMLILEQMAHEGTFRCNSILVHTANASARTKMYQCADKIMEYSKEPYDFRKDD
jgi:hypothetical protein